MSSLKKIAISIVFMIIAILGITNISNGYYVGQSVTLTSGQYLGSNNIFCVEHGQKIKARMYYNIISNVRIQGTVSTDQTGKTIDSKDNARFAYILSRQNQSKRTIQNAVWNFAHTWMANVGQYHEGLYVGFAGTTKGSSTFLDQDAIDYANDISDVAEATDNTNKDNIRAVAYERDGQQFIRIGPFNWSFGGTLTELSVLDQDSNAISGLTFSSFRGNEETFFGMDGIQSNSDFYISIPSNGNVSRITKITGKAQMDVAGVNIWFLESTETYLQNMIIREPLDAKQDIDLSFDYDIPITGSLKVVKVNEDNTEVKLPGVGFYIMNDQLGKYVKQDESGNISYVDTREEATEFITDQNGEFLVENLLVGTYTAYETQNPNYGYELSTVGEPTRVVADDTTEFQIGNKQIYVKLSGFVWVDKDDGKTWERNDLYATNYHPEINDYTDGNDILLDGITVRLKDRTTGETVMETVTANGGKYQFVDVLIEKLQDYYVEFEYDGLTYTNVVPNLDPEYEENSSKSAENATVRDEFNKDFSVIEGATESSGITLDENGNKVYDLNYNVDQNAHTSTLINNGQYLITGNTDETGYSIWDNFEYGMEEVKWINQGLYERVQPDLAVVKDLQNVRIAVNGYEHVYEYAQRFANQDVYKEGFNVGVKFVASRYAEMSYTRAIYKADYEYINEADSSKELKVYATYKIALRNESSDLVSQVNSILDYYDSSYTLLRAGTELDGNGQITGTELTHTDSSYNDEYSKTVIDTNIRLDPNTESYVYVEFQLDRETVVNLLNDGEVLDNVTEINSYSTFDTNGNVYAGIDVDSNPANAVPGNSATYEDDTDKSPGFKLEVADARVLTGKVFLDESELTEAGIRQGSGQYEDGETGIPGVTVTLTENTGSGKVYTTTTKTTADESGDIGDFIITGFIPGDYTLTYTWGDETYTVQNFKGTVYDKTRYDANTANKEWYKTEDVRYTDAVDNYDQDQEAPKGSRLQIDDEIKVKTNNSSNEITRHQMDSTTPTMGIGVEYESVYTASTGDRYTYEIKDIDFGIVERARQKVDLTKRVKSLTLTLANGQVVTEATFDEDGNVTGTIGNLTYMRPSENASPSNGYVRVELDNELIQGATLEVGYEIKVENLSELDYLSENFYKYGIVEGNVVTITPSAIIDYLDNGWSIEMEENPGWEIRTLDEIRDIVSDSVYNDENSTINDKHILYTENLSNVNLAPNESASTDLTVSKILASTDDISLDNEAEMNRLEKTGGSDPVEIPGNHIPGTTDTESDDSMAETVIVTPPTGTNLSFIIPIVIGVAALVVLGVGIFLIKRKALGNK